MSSSPCRRSHPAGASRRVSRVRRAVLPSPLNREARPPGLWYFGATCAFTSVTARGLTHHPSDGLVGVSVSLHPATQVTGLWLLPRRDWLPLDTSAFSGRTVDHQLELRRLLYGEVTGLGALEDLIDEPRRMAEEVGVVRAVTSQTSCFHILSRADDGR